MADIRLTWHQSHTDNHLVEELCYLSETDHRPGALNLRPRDYHINPHVLMYKLHTEKLYDTGGYGVVTHSGRPVAGGGWHQMPWHPDIYYIGNRSYTLPGQNFCKPQDVLWEAQYRQSKLSGARVILGSFNLHNQKIIDRSIKINDPHNHVRAHQIRGEWYREPGKLILPLKKISHSVTIAHTEQWIFYHMIDPDFESEFLDICKNNEFLT